MEPESNLKHVKLSIVLVLLLLLIGALGFSIFSKGLIADLYEAKKQVNSLINEVGEVRENDRVLSANIEKEIREGIAEYEENLKKAAEREDEKIEADRPKIMHLPKGRAGDINALDFLLVGQHSGLTDTIILASVNHDLKTITFTSVPRDIYIDGRKINEFFEFYGVKKLAEEVSKVTGVKAEKYAVIDMETFKKFIDLIGGIDIAVEKDIYDGYYPDDKGYNEPYSIKKGDYHFDGEEALKYARSRKTTSDFDRSRRQQDILSAIRKQIMAADYLNKMKDLTAVYTVLLRKMETNIDIFETVNYLRKFQDYEFETGNVLSTNNFLYSLINENGAYILLPKSESYDEVKEYVRGLIEE